MPFSVDQNMGITEFAISRAVMELSEQMDKFSSFDIAIYIDSDPSTVRRKLPGMIKAGIIGRQGSKRGGFRYLCLKPNYNWDKYDG